MKKLLALVLALVMTLGLATVGANAATYTDADSISHKEAVQVMSALEVFDGMNGAFNPAGTLTREQGAKIIAYMILGKTAADSLSTAAAPFDDVAADRWSAGSIAYCVTEGIIGGVGNNKFNPEGSLTGYAFAKMLLCALGYNAQAEGFNNNEWQINAAKLARNAGLNDDLDSLVMSQPITREQACQMAFNTETAKMVEYTGGVNVKGEGMEVTVDSKRNYVENSATTYYKNGATGIGLGAENQMQFCEQYATKLKLDSVTNADDFARPASTWEYKGTKVGTYASSPVKTYTTGVEDITLGQLYTDLGNTGLIDVWENGDNNDANTNLNNVTPAKGDTNTKPFKANHRGATIEFYDANSDGLVDKCVIAYPFLGKVTKVTEAKGGADRSVTVEIYYAVAGSGTKTTKTFDTKEFAKDDYVLAYVAGGLDQNNAGLAGRSIVDLKPADTVKGTVSTVSLDTGANTGALVNGAKLPFGGLLISNMGLTGATIMSTTAFSYGKDYTFYTANGYALGAKGDVAAKDIENIVYVTDATYNANGEWGAVQTVEYIDLEGVVHHVSNFGNSTFGTNTADAAGTTTTTPIAKGFYQTYYDGTTKTYKFAPIADIDMSNSWSTEINNSTVYYKDAKINGPISMKADTKIVAAQNMDDTDPTNVYLTDSTRMIFVKGSKSTLKTSFSTGAMKQTIPDNSLVLLSRDGSALTVEAIIFDNVTQINAGSDTYWLDATVRGESKIDGNTVKFYRVYDVATGEYQDLPMDPADVGGVTKYDGGKGGFVTLGVDANGVYTPTDVAKAGANDADGVYDIADKTKITRYNNTVNIDGTTAADLTGADASNARVITLVTGKDTDELSLADITASTVTTLVATAYYYDEALVAIVVTTYTAP